MAKGKLSERQQEMITFIGSFSRDKGYPPTIRQIGEAVGISSTSVVNYNLNKLEREGYIMRDLSDVAAEVVPLPMVAAGAGAVRAPAERLAAVG